MRSTSFATQGARRTSSWSPSLSVSRGRRSRSPSLLACHACVLSLAVRWHVAAMVLCDPRAHPLHAALGCPLVPPDEPELRRLHRWLDAWRGGGAVVTERHRQGDA